MFAIVKIGAKQYKVAPKDVILVAKIKGKSGDSIDIPDVLLVQNDKNIKIGKPKVTGAKVTAKILDQEKGEKINVRRYKNKVRYRRSTGFRAQVTRLEITGVTAS